MYNVRMPDLTVDGKLNSNIQQNLTQYSKKMLQVSSGENYSTRSENIVQTTEAAGLSVSQAQLNQWTSNMKYANSWETITNSNVTTILSSMQALDELVTEANSTLNTATASDRTSLLEETNSILKSLVDSGNAKYQGVNLFAGTATCNDAFTATYNTNGTIASVSFLNGGTTALREVPYGNGSDYAMGVLGEGTGSLFQFDYTDSTGTTSSVRLFDELIKFRDVLADTTKTLDPENLKKLQAGLDNVTNVSVTMGTKLNTVTRIAGNLTNSTEVAQNRYDDIMDVDASAAVTELYQVQSALQASMQMVNKINDMSILNYIG